MMQATHHYISAAACARAASPPRSPSCAAPRGRRRPELPVCVREGISNDASPQKHCDECGTAATHGRLVMTQL